MSVKFDTVMPASKMAGDDAEDTRLLRKALADAEAFLTGHAWCERIQERYFGAGIGGIVSVFLFEIIPSRSDIDALLWVVVGDVPSAYLVTDEARDPAEALAQYIALMKEWTAAAMGGGGMSTVYPVAAAATLENVEALESRLNYLESELLPEWRERYLVPSPRVRGEG
jgi:hypothetical protein